MKNLNLIDLRIKIWIIKIERETERERWKRDEMEERVRDRTY
jgi:hypothetical protein